MFVCGDVLKLLFLLDYFDVGDTGLIVKYCEVHYKFHTHTV